MGVLPQSRSGCVVPQCRPDCDVDENLFHWKVQSCVEQKALKKAMKKAEKRSKKEKRRIRAMKKAEEKSLMEFLEGQSILSKNPLAIVSRKNYFSIDFNKWKETTQKMNEEHDDGTCSC